MCSQLFVGHLLIAQHHALAMCSWPPVLEKDIISYNAAMTARRSRWQMCLALLHALPTLRLEPTVVTFNVVMGACESANLWQMALEVLHVLQLHLKASVVTFLTAISACGKGQKWEAACELLAEAQSQRLEAVEVYNALITALQRSMQWQRALHCFNEMRRAHKVDRRSFNAAHAACAACSGLWEVGLSLVSQANSLNIESDQVSQNSRITACVKGDSWKAAVLLFSQCQGQADVIAYGALSGACDRGSRWRQAMHVQQQSIAIVQSDL